MPKEPIKMTARGFEKLKEELRYLNEERRQELADYMGAAIADGDISESAAYDEARILQSANEVRIADLEELVHRAVIVEHDPHADAVASLGASLTLENEDGENIIFHLVGTHEADVLEGRVSDESPLGRSLVGKRIGDNVTVNMPIGETVYRVVDVQFDV